VSKPSSWVPLFLSIPYCFLLNACSGGSNSPPPMPTVTITAASGTVNLGQSVMLSWSSANANSCTASASPNESDWSGTQATRGSLSVTPAASGIISYTLTCTGMGGSVSRVASIVVSAPANLSITSGQPPVGQVGTSYGSSFSLTAAGGVKPYQWTWVNQCGSTRCSALPPGLTLATNADSTGTISGTPTAAGNYVVIVTVSDSGSPVQHANTTYNIVIGGGPSSALTITSGSPPNGTATMAFGPQIQYKCNWSPILGWHMVCFPCLPGVVTCGTPFPPCRGAPVPCYRNSPGFVFTASGGMPPYSWSWSAAASSALPPGLSLDPHYGIASGTPSTPGTYTVIVTVTDSASPQAQTNATYTLTINVPSPPVINPSPTPAIGTVNAFYSFTFSASGGLAPLTWNKTGALPAGLSLASNGTLAGTPTQTGSFPISVTAEDAAQQNSAPQNFTIQVLLHGFTPTGNMQTARRLHTASLLNDGRVLVAGGSGDSSFLASAEIYDPAGGTFSATGDMETTRMEHTATTLKDGKVLVTGGITDANSNPVATAEIFDPAKGTFAPTGTMATARYLHVATLLNDGRVLVSGGSDGTTQLSTAELFDPTTGSFSPAGSMLSARLQHTATLLKDARVLLAGGVDGTGAEIASAEIFDPASNAFTATGNMAYTRWGHAATVLCDLSSATCNNQKVLVTGGDASATAEVFDPSTGTFTTVGSMETIRSFLTATLLPDATLLVAGGQQPDTSVLSSAELFDPATGNFTSAADMSSARENHTAIMLKTGAVLVTGGLGGSPSTLTTLATAEIYK
jgi:hypothetical protein